MTAPRSLRAAALALAALGAGGALAAPTPVASNLVDLSLEQLGNIQVSLVTGRPSTLQEAAASIYVITGDQIRRSAATTLPEALRLAPNLQVAQLNAGQWAISARGFNNAIGNKLLVMIDGRTVYSPLFSGVFWDEQEVALADIDRIEVISGPGATLWGANAVNGVINIVMKPAAETQGALVQGTGGGEGTQALARYGGRFGNGGHYRVYALSEYRNNTVLGNGAQRTDASSRAQAGFRIDSVLGGARVTLQGDAYHAGDSPASNLSPRLAGGNLLGRWMQQREDGSNWQLQAYYDRSSREDQVLFYERTETLDLQFSNALSPSGSQRLIWGGGYRRAHSETDRNRLVVFDPTDRTLQWSNLFVQDELHLAPALRLTLGTKVETNVYTGAEWLPTLRLAYDLGERGFAWAEASRAVRAPARIDRDFHFPGSAPYAIEGGPDFVSETANVIEAGYRAQPSERTSWSLTVFHADYGRLRGGTPGQSFIENRVSGTENGVEAWGDVDPLPGWRLSAGLLSLHKSLQPSPGTSPNSPSDLGNDPDFQWLLRSTADLGHGLDFDVTLRHVGSLPQPAVPAYTATDLRLAWQATPTLSAAVLVQNAFDPQHVEFNPPGTASEIPRAAYLRLTWAMR
jgi:iron complex outermembrane receptor protein